jgi:hypothetical protein
MPIHFQKTIRCDNMISTTSKFHTPIDARWPHGLCRLFILLQLAFAILNTSTLKAQIAGPITVYPGGETIEIGTSRQLTAYVPISPNTVTWSVNDIPGGNSTIGTISAVGLYKAPAVAPNASVITIKATSIPYPASVGAAIIRITRKYPWVWSVSLASLTVGNYQVTFNGSNFAPDSQALANGTPLPTVYFDFGRSLQPSGSGSDHGWGNHHLILGGAVHGGTLYGTFPSMALGGPDDSGTRGAMIPTTSIDQYGATLAQWFGVPADQLTSVFPNLTNFANSTLPFMG